VPEVCPEYPTSIFTHLFDLSFTVPILRIGGL